MTKNGCKSTQTGLACTQTTSFNPNLFPPVSQSVRPAHFATSSIYLCSWLPWTWKKKCVLMCLIFSKHCWCSSLGKPRRFSDQFLKEEKDKLNQYRDSFRTHYTELRSGSRDGLPTDLARPLAVGQRVIAVYPRTKEIHDGTVLTVDHDRCRVQFDRPELGAEIIMVNYCILFSLLLLYTYNNDVEVSFLFGSITYYTKSSMK